MAKKVINAFNGGEVSPNTHARFDSELYNKACIKLENFVPLSYGGADRRPATQYKETLGTNKSVCYPFIFNSSNTYNLIFSNTSLAIYADGTLKATLSTPYLEAELYELKFTQSADIVWIVHKNHAVRQLSRVGDTSWTIQTFDYKFPPLLDETDATFSISGAAEVDGTINITASTNGFYSTHVGSQFLIKQVRDNNNSILSRTKVAADDEDLSSALNASFSNWSFETRGTTWKGKVSILRSVDGGNNYEEYVYIGDTGSGTNKNFTFASTEPEPANSLLKVQYIKDDAGSSDGAIEYELKIDSPYLYGLVTITAVGAGASSTVGVATATATVNSPLAYTTDDFAPFFTGSVTKGDLLKTVSSWNATIDNTAVSKTITSSGTTATVAFTSHNFTTADLIVVSGADADGASYNGTFKIASVPDANSFTYTMDSDPADDSVTANVQKHKTLQLNDNSGSALTNVRDMAIGESSNILYVLSQAPCPNTGSKADDSDHTENAVIYKYTLSNQGTKDVAVTNGTLILNHTVTSSLAAATGIAFYNNKIYVSWVSKIRNYDWDGNSHKDGLGNCVITRYATDGTLEFTSTDKFGVSGTYPTGAIGWQGGNQDSSAFNPEPASNGLGLVVVSNVPYLYGFYTAYTRGTGGNINKFERKLTVNRYNINDDSHETVDTYLDQDYTYYQNLAGDAPYSTSTNSSSEYADTNRKGHKYYSDIAASRLESATILRLNASNDNIEAVSINAIEANSGTVSQTYPVPTISSQTDYSETLCGMAYFESDSRFYVVSKTGKLFEFAFSGSVSYYEAQQTYTSTDFNADIAAGKLTRRYPESSNYQESAFNSFRGFPNAVAIYESRLCFGGTANNPNTLWLSKSNDLNNYQTGSVATDSMRLTINSGTIDEIVWFCATKNLVIGTTSDEWTLGSGSDQLAISPTQFELKRRTNYGSKNLQAFLINNSVMFFMREGKNFREWEQSNQVQFTGTNLSFIAEHIVKGGILQFAYQTEPETIIWMVRNDGVLVGLTYDKELGIFGWHKHSFTGATVEAVSVLPQENNVDKVYLVLKKGSDRCYVCMDSREWGTNYITDYNGLDNYITYTNFTGSTLGSHTISSAVSNASNFVTLVFAQPHNLSVGDYFTLASLGFSNTDPNGEQEVSEVVSTTSIKFNLTVGAGETYTHGSATCFDHRLKHLAGDTATFKINGATTGTATVDGSNYSLAVGSQSSANLVVGLPYTSTLAPLYIQSQATLGSKKPIQKATIRFKDTLSAKTGQTETDTDPVIFTSNSALNTEDAEVWLSNANEFLQTVYVVQDEPQPCTVLAMIANVEKI